jgi:hypothetical protein
VALLRPSAFLLALCAFFAVGAVHTAELRAAEAARKAAVAGCKPIAPRSKSTVAQLARHTAELERLGVTCPG